MRRAVPATAATLALTGLTGCDRTAELTRQPVQLGPSGITFESPNLVVRGPQIDLCVLMPPGTNYSAVTGNTRNRHGRVVNLSAQLVSQSGRAFDLGRPGVSVGRSVRLCFSPDRQVPEGQQFRAVVLRAADTLTVAEITWWSGAHTKLFP